MKKSLISKKTFKRKYYQNNVIKLKTLLRPGGPVSENMIDEGRWAYSVKVYRTLPGSHPKIRV